MQDFLHGIIELVRETLVMKALHRNGFIDEVIPRGVFRHRWLRNLNVRDGGNILNLSLGEQM